MIDEKPTTRDQLTHGSHISRAALNQTERCLVVQQRLANIYGEFINHWLQRRQSAVETALDTTKKILSSGGGSGRIPAFCEEWLKGSWQRVSDDIREYQSCMGEAAKVVRDGLTQISQQSDVESRDTKP